MRGDLFYSCGMGLSDFPRVRFGHFPTPLEPMDNLRRALGGGPRLFIKRDDCTGLATGGNKTRKLEFLMGDALAQKAEMVVTQGAVQSNHVRQTAAAAARCGMDCRVLLERRVAGAGAEYEQTGNILLNDIFGARYEFRPAGADMNAEAESLCAEFRAKGRNVYFIPGGGSNPTGALGYADCAAELAEQCAAMDLRPAWVVHATGSAGTQAGLLAGLAALDAPDAPKTLGISVRLPEKAQVANVAALAGATADLLGVSSRFSPDDVVVDDRFVGAGYGVPSDETIAAIELLAREEGILLDPVYSGKGFAGFVARIREGAFRNDDAVIFLHTGGAVALFAYRRNFAPMRAESSTE